MLNFKGMTMGQSAFGMREVRLQTIRHESVHHAVGCFRGNKPSWQQA